MSAIVRRGVTPRWADSVSYQGLLWIVEVPGAGADITTQTQSLLALLEQQLLAAGSGRAGLLQATIYLADMADLGAFNAVWDAWLPPGQAPVRACLGGVQLADPAWRVEIAVVAAVSVVDGKENV